MQVIETAWRGPIGLGDLLQTLRLMLVVVSLMQWPELPLRVEISRPVLDSRGRSSWTLEAKCRRNLCQFLIER